MVANKEGLNQKHQYRSIFKPIQNSKYRNKHKITNNGCSENVSVSSKMQVEAYKNPTDLFQWINFGRWDKAIKRTMASPEEASIWIYSIDKESGRKKWMYLPIHMVCLQPNPPLGIIQVLIKAYSKGVRCRDLDGNLAIHYLCSEACVDKDILSCLIDAYPKCLYDKDKYGRTPTQIVQKEFYRRKMDPEVIESIISFLHSKKRNGDECRQDRFEKVIHYSKSERQDAEMELIVRENKASKKAISHLNVEIENENAQREKMEEENSKLKLELDNLKSAQVDDKKFISDLESKLTVNCEENTSLRKEINELTEKNVLGLGKKCEIEVEVTSLHEQSKKLRGENMELQKNLIEETENHNTQLNSFKQLSIRQLSNQKELFEGKMEEKKKAIQKKFEQLPKKFDEMKLTFQKKFDEQKSFYEKKINTQIEDSKEQETHYAEKIDGLTSMLWKNEESNRNQQRELGHMKKDNERNINDVTFEYERKIEDQKHSYQCSLFEYKQEKRKAIDDLALSNKEIDALRTTITSLTEDNLGLRREIEDQCIEFDKKLLNVRKAVAFQADAFSLFQTENLLEDSTIASVADNTTSKSNQEFILNSIATTSTLLEEAGEYRKLFSNEEELLLKDKLDFLSPSAVSKSLSSKNNQLFVDCFATTATFLNDAEGSNEKLINSISEKHAAEVENLKNKKRITLLMNENKELSNELEESRKEMVKISSNLTYEEERIQQLLKQRNESQKEISDLFEKNNNLKTEIKEIQEFHNKERTSQEKVIQDLNSDLTLYQSKINDLHENNKKSTKINEDDLQQNKISLDTLQSSLSKMQEEMNIDKINHLKEISDLEQKETTLRTQCDGLVEENNELKQQLTEHIKEKKHIIQQVDSLQLRIEKLQNDNNWLKITESTNEAKNSFSNLRKGFTTTQGQS